MLAVINYSNARDNLAEVFRKAAVKSETVVVTCENEQNVVIISLEKYNFLEKAAANAECLRMLDKSVKELESGGFVVRSMAELEACES